MNRRIAIALAAALGSTLAFPLAARADQAILIHDAVIDLAPGEVVDRADVLIMSQTGIPTVAFDGATGFADNETVVATITLSTKDIDGLGSVELLGSPTISGTTTADWTTGEPSYFEFEPAIQVRYTAPSAVDLGCDDHPGERFTTHLGVSATLVGSAGTIASFSADDFPGTVSFVTICPASAPPPEAPTVTTPPTNSLPAPDAAGPGTDWASSLILVVAAGAGALIVLTRRSRTHRSRR
jgi:hypothetical protein